MAVNENLGQSFAPVELVEGDSEDANSDKKGTPKKDNRSPNFGNKKENIELLAPNMPEVAEQDEDLFT